MKDFLVSSLVSMVVNILLVAPYLDPLRETAIEMNIMSEVDANRFYYFTLFGIILFIGIIVYMLLGIIEYMINRK